MSLKEREDLTRREEQRRAAPGTRHPPEPGEGAVLGLLRGLKLKH